MLAKAANKIKQCKEWIEPHKNDLFIAAVIILVAIIGFGLGRLSAVLERKTPIRVEYGTGAAATTERGGNIAAETPNTTQKRYVASRQSDKYHLPECIGAQRIKEENKIWFSSREEAEAAGFKPAGNCEGL